MSTLQFQFLILIIAGWVCLVIIEYDGLGNELIEKPSDEIDMNSAVECRERLGGILKYYYRRAA